MSRPLTFILLVIPVLNLVACVTQPEHSADAGHTQELVYYDELQRWLALQKQVESMTAEQVNLELQVNSRPANSDELFYRALLNQQLDVYGNWTLARDQFRELSGASGLTDQQRQLASILERYNQSRINWYKQHQSLQDKYQSMTDENRTLQDQLSAARVERELLEQKIQALTDLETSISTRRE